MNHGLCNRKNLTVVKLGFDIYADLLNFQSIVKYDGYSFLTKVVIMKHYFVWIYGK